MIAYNSSLLGEKMIFKGCEKGWKTRPKVEIGRYSTLRKKSPKVSSSSRNLSNVVNKLRANGLPLFLLRSPPLKSAVGS